MFYVVVGFYDSVVFIVVGDSLLSRMEGWDPLIGLTPDRHIFPPFPIMTCETQVLCRGLFFVVERVMVSG